MLSAKLANSDICCLCLFLKNKHKKLNGGGGWTRTNEALRSEFTARSHCHQGTPPYKQDTTIFSMKKLKIRNTEKFYGIKNSKPYYSLQLNLSLQLKQNFLLCNYFAVFVSFLLVKNVLPLDLLIL